MPSLDEHFRALASSLASLSGTEREDYEEDIFGERSEEIYQAAIASVNRAWAAVELSAQSKDKPKDAGG